MLKCPVVNPQKIYSCFFIFVFLFCLYPILTMAGCGRDIPFKVPTIYEPFDLLGARGYVVVDHRKYMYPVFIDHKLLDGKGESMEVEIENNKKQQATSLQESHDRFHEQHCKESQCLGKPKVTIISPEYSCQYESFYEQMRMFKNLLFNGFSDMQDDRFMDGFFFDIKAQTGVTLCPYEKSIRKRRLIKLFAQDFLFLLMQIGDQWLQLFVNNPDEFMSLVNAIGKTPITIIKEIEKGSRKEKARLPLTNRNGQPVTLENCYCYASVRKNYASHSPKQVVVSSYRPQSYKTSKAGLSAVERSQGATNGPIALLGIDAMGPDVGVCTLSIIIYDVLKNHAMPHRMIAMNSLIESLMALFYQKSLLTKSINTSLNDGYVKELRDYVPFKKYFKYDSDFCCDVCLPSGEYITAPEAPDPTHSENAYFACCRMFGMSLQWAFTQLSFSKNPKEALVGILSQYYRMAYEFFPQDLNAIAFTQRIRFKQNMQHNSDYFWHFLVSLYNQKHAGEHLENTPAQSEATKKVVAEKLAKVHINLFDTEAINVFNQYCVRVLNPEQIFSAPYYKTLLQKHEQIYQPKRFLINLENEFEKKTQEIERVMYHLDSTWCTRIKNYRTCVFNQLLNNVKEHARRRKLSGFFQHYASFIPVQLLEVLESMFKSIFNKLPPENKEYAQKLAGNTPIIYPVAFKPDDICVLRDSIINGTYGYVRDNGTIKWICFHDSEDNKQNNDFNICYQNYIDQEQMLFSIVSKIIQPITQKRKLLKAMLADALSENVMLSSRESSQVGAGVRVSTEEDMQDWLHDFVDIWQLVQNEIKEDSLLIQTGRAKRTMEKTCENLDLVLYGLRIALEKKSPDLDLLADAHQRALKTNLDVDRELKCIVRDLNKQREKQMKIKKILKEMAAMDMSPPDYDCMCPICLESSCFKNEDGSLKPECFVITPCNHKFCIDCYEGLKNSSVSSHHGSCPVCRGLYVSEGLSKSTGKRHGMHLLKPVTDAYLQRYMQMNR